MEDLANFARLVEAIRPWLTHVIIVGGWAHRLYRFHPLATAQEYQPIRTRDVDLVFSPDAPLDGDLREALRKAGFNEEVSGESTPPVTHYQLGQEDAGFYAEFLTVRGERREARWATGRDRFESRYHRAKVAAPRSAFRSAVACSRRGRNYAGYSPS